MASRKKKTASTRSSSVSVAREFSVIVEDVRSQFKVFGEALLGLREQVASGFEDVNRRFERVEGDIGLVKTAVIEHGRELKEIRGEIGVVKTELKDIGGAVARLEEKIDKKVDRGEVEAIVEGVLAHPRSH